MMLFTRYYCLFCIIFIYNHELYASAQLIDPTKYRVSIGFSRVDTPSEIQKEQRANLYMHIMQTLERLREHIKEVNNKSAIYSLLYKQISHLEKISQELPTYQDKQLRIFSIEYGISDTQNIGADLLFKDNSFGDKHYNKFEYTNKEISIFYKLQLVRQNNFILSVQPKIIVQRNWEKKEHYYNELSVLTGFTKELDNLTFFIENVVSFTSTLKSALNYKQYFACSTSEGVKFSNGIMLTSFSRYYMRRGYGLTYKNTLYQQLSVAKETKVANHKNTITLQIGYFWDKSLRKKNYMVSGGVLSLWLDF